MHEISITQVQSMILPLSGEIAWGQQGPSSSTIAETSSAAVEPLKRTFEDLADRWRAETGTASSTLETIVTHWAYQRIIGLGPRAVPLILEKLEREPDHWGWALAAITGEDPVPPSAEGDIVAIADAWLAWGLRHGRSGS